jgi:argininosuccinate lyase
LSLAAPLIEGAELDRAAIGERLNQGYLDATALMEYLIRRGTAQRTAHALVGRLVGRAMERGVSLSGLPLGEFQAADTTLDKSVFDILGAEKVVAAMASYGSTNPAHVGEQVRQWKKRLGLE